MGQRKRSKIAICYVLFYLLFFGVILSASLLVYAEKQTDDPWIETRIVDIKWNMSSSYEDGSKIIEFVAYGEVWNPTADVIKYQTPDACVFVLNGSARIASLTSLIEIRPRDSACAQVISSIDLPPGITDIKRRAQIEVTGSFDDLPEGKYNFTLLGRSQSIHGVFHTTRIVFLDGKPAIVLPNLADDWGYRKSPATDNAGFLRLEIGMLVFTFMLLATHVRKTTKL